MNSYTIDNNQTYKQCAGKNCTRIGINPLKIVYVNKIGYFCDACANDLIKLEIAVNATPNEVEAEVA